MIVNILKSKTVCNNNSIFVAHIGYKHYDFGLQVHEWGIRFMLVWWHICINIKD